MGQVRTSDAAYSAAPTLVGVRAFLCLAVLVTAILWTRQSAHDGAQRSVVYAADQSAYEDTDFRPWLSDEPTDASASATDRLDAATEIRTVDRQPVECERPLELALFVHDADGTPVRGAEVLCDWQDQRGSHKLEAVTDLQGIARVRRWIPAQEFGRVTRIRVHVETERWRAERWVWFIPR